MNRFRYWEWCFWLIRIYWIENQFCSECLGFMRWPYALCLVKHCYTITVSLLMWLKFRNLNDQSMPLPWIWHFRICSSKCSLCRIINVQNRLCWKINSRRNWIVKCSKLKVNVITLFRLSFFRATHVFIYAKIRLLTYRRRQHQPEKYVYSKYPAHLVKQNDISGARKVSRHFQINDSPVVPFRQTDRQTDRRRRRRWKRAKTTETKEIPKQIAES